MWTDGDRIQNTSQAVSFLRSMSLRVPLQNVKKVLAVLMGNGRSKRSLYTTPGNTGVVGKGTVKKIEDLYKNGRLSPFLDYLDGGRYQESASEPDDVQVITGFDELDMITGGLFPGDLVVIGGEPSVGKTSLAMNIMLNNSGREVSVGWVDLAVSAEIGKQALLAIDASIDQHRVRLGLLTETEGKRIAKSTESVSEFIHFIQARNADVASIRQRAEELCANSTVRLILVDYLELVSTANPTTSVSATGHEILMGLKTMARELGVTVVVLSSLASVSINPQISDFPKSSGVNQHADIAMLLRRENRVPVECENSNRLFGVLEIVVAKNRHGTLGRTKLMLRDNLRFQTMPSESSL
jgi:replicative DNA helicase